jgi:hypothetical protein
MAKKDYKIRAKFVFDGQVIVRAKTRQDAEAKAEKYIASSLGNIESLDDDIQDWDFNIKGNTVVNRKQDKENGTIEH